MQFKRVLGLKDIVFYGIVLNQPVGAVGLFGIVSVISNGHIILTILFSMVAMLLTGFSYGRMAAIYPQAGSAYLYVGKGLNFHLGFIAGWCMVLCYLTIPIINTVFGVITLQRLFPFLSYPVGTFLLISLMTLLNLAGVKISMKFNKYLLYLMLITILLFFILSFIYLLKRSDLISIFSFKILYNKEYFSFNSLFAGSSLIALTFIGFDGITTLSEEVKNPKRNILLGITIVCLFTGIFSSLQMCFAHQVSQFMWQDGSAEVSTPFFSRIPDAQVETSFMTVCKEVGGNFLFIAMTGSMFLACLGSGIAGQIGAARILYAMGKDDIIPKKVFSYLDTKNSTPVYNIILIGIITLIGALALNYQKTAELLNFAALVGFMGVNLSVIGKFYPDSFRNVNNLFKYLLLPLLGLVFSFWIWINLSKNSLFLGSIWVLAGVVLLIFSTNFFRKKPVTFEFKEF